MITQNFELDIIPGGVPTVVHVKQYQTDEILTFKLFSRRGRFDITDTISDCSIRGTKADGNGYSATISSSDIDIYTYSVSVKLTEQMTAVAGEQPFEITMTDSTGKMITATFILDVQRAALDAETVTSESVLRELEDLEELLNDGIGDWMAAHPEATTSINDGAVTTAKLAGSAVTTAKINNSAVTTAKINNLAVTEGKIADGAVTTNKLGSSAVTTAKINNGAVTADKLASSAVTSAKIGSGAVTTAKINDGAVTNDKVADRTLTIGKVSEFDEKMSLTPTETYTTSYSNCQGMACDDTYFYLTYRSSTSDATAMNLAKINMSTMQTASTGTLTTGHFNNLYYYNNKIYASGGEYSSSAVNYKKVAVIDPSTLSVATTKTTPEKVWGVGVIKPGATKSACTAFFLAEERMIDFYVGYANYQDESKQYPLTRVCIDYTGCTTVQGSFHMTNNYIYFLETAYNTATRASGHQVVRCCSYSGMIVKSYYLDSITTELQDIYVTSGDSIMYLNDAGGKIYKYTLPTLYKTLRSGISVAGTLKPGTVKNVYVNESPLDVYHQFNGGKVYSKFVLNDYAFTSEVAEYFVPWIQFAGHRYAGSIDTAGSTMRFANTRSFDNGDSIFFHIVYTRSSDTYNYWYYMSSGKFVYRHNDGTVDVWSATNSDVDGDVSDVTTGLGKVLYNLYNTGLINADIFVYSLSYVCGTRFNYQSLGMLV